MEFFNEEERIYTIVALEGADGIGKTTIAKELVKRINETTEYEAVYYREPGGNEDCEKIRKTIMSLPNLEKFSQLMLFFASRNELYKKNLLPDMKKGKIIILDRFIMSSMVYQKDIAMSTLLYKTITGKDRVKFITICLDANNELILSRIKNKDDEDSNFFDEESLVKQHIEDYRKLCGIFKMTGTFPGTLFKHNIKGDLETDVNTIIEGISNIGIANKEYDNLVDELIMHPDKKYQVVASAITVEDLKKQYNKVEQLGNEGLIRDSEVVMTPEQVKEDAIRSIKTMCEQMRISKPRGKDINKMNFVQLTALYDYVKYEYDKIAIADPKNIEDIDGQPLNSITLEEELSKMEEEALNE